MVCLVRSSEGSGVGVYTKLSTAHLAPHCSIGTVTFCGLLLVPNFLGIFSAQAVVLDWCHRFPDECSRIGFVTGADFTANANFLTRRLTLSGEGH